jgi:hypothetical protein
MSERVDRRIGSNRALLVVVAILFAAAAGGVYVWSRMTGPSPSALQSGALQSGTSPARPARPDEPLMVTLYVPGSSALSAGLVPVKRQPDTQAQAREVLNAALSDLNAVQSPVLKEMKLRELFLDAAGACYVDVTPVPQAGIKASAWEELLALYAIVNTLTQNFEEIKQVRFLVEGREAQSLAGHIDLSRTFSKRMDLVKQ